MNGTTIQREVPYIRISSAGNRSMPATCRTCMNTKATVDVNAARPHQYPTLLTPLSNSAPFQGHSTAVLADINECHAKQTSTLQSGLMLRFREADVHEGQLRVITGHRAC